MLSRQGPEVSPEPLLKLEFWPEVLALEVSVVPSSLETIAALELSLEPEPELDGVGAALLRV